MSLELKIAITCLVVAVLGYLVSEALRGHQLGKHGHLHRSVFGPSNLEIGFSLLVPLGLGGIGLSILLALW